MSNRACNKYISQLCRALLLIIDDFGMERGTEYGLEQVYNVIDSRYRSKKKPEIQWLAQKRPSCFDCRYIRGSQ